MWKDEHIPVLDIDVQGAIHVQKEYPVNSLFIFIKPPSIDELKKRLESRGSESPDSIHTRVSKAEYELSFANQFAHVIENHDFETACKDAVRIVKEFIDLPAGRRAGN